MTVQPVQAAFESQIVRALRGMGLDIAFTTARTTLIALCTVGLLPVAVLASVAAALLADGGPAAPVSVGTAPVGAPAAILALWWLVQPFGEWVRRWSPRPLGRREPVLRYAQSAIGCDARSVFLVEVVLPGALKLVPLIVFSVAVLVRHASRTDRILVAAAIAAGAVLLLTTWNRAVQEVGGIRAASRAYLGPAVTLPAAALAGLVAGRLVVVWDQPMPRLGLPAAVLIAVGVVLGVVSAVQAWHLIRATAAAEGRPLRPAAAPGLAVVAGEPAPLGGPGRRWTTSFWRTPLRAGIAGSWILVLPAAFVAAAPPVADVVGGFRFAPVAAGFVVLSCLAAAVGTTPGSNLVTAGPSHRMLYELGRGRRFGYWLSAGAEACRALMPAAVLSVVWASVWPAVWYLPVAVATGAVAGALLADALIGSSTNLRVSELQRVAFSSVVLAVAFVVWQISLHSLLAAGAVVGVVLLIGEELWAYKIQKLTLN